MGKEQLERIMRLISNKKIIAKRGGHLCAPVPRGEIGCCGYIQDLTYEEVETSIQEYKALCETFPRGGRGVDAHCKDVGLEDPSTTCNKVDVSDLKQENERLKAALAAAEKRIA